MLSIKTEGGAGWKNLVAAWGQAEHRSVCGEQLYCAPLGGFGVGGVYSFLSP